jgi:hypothetical protein
VDGTISDAQVHLWLQDIADSGYVSLHFDTPALGGIAKAEISGGGYQRFKMSWSNPANRAIWSVVDARFTGLVQTKVTYFGIWDALGQRNLVTKKPALLMAYTELETPVAVLNGKGFVIPAGQIAVSMG